MPKSASQDQRTYTIGALAAEFGLTLRTIRFYEDEGLLSPTRQGLARIFDHRDHGRLALICRGKRLGFSVAEIKQFLDLYQTGAKRRQDGQLKYLLGQIGTRRESLARQLADVQQTLAELATIERDITAHLEKRS